MKSIKHNNITTLGESHGLFHPICAPRCKLTKEGYEAFTPGHPSSTVGRGVTGPYSFPSTSYGLRSEQGRTLDISVEIEHRHPSHCPDETFEVLPTNLKMRLDNARHHATHAHDPDMTHRQRLERCFRAKFMTDVRDLNDQMCDLKGHIFFRDL